MSQPPKCSNCKTEPARASSSNGARPHLCVKCRLLQPEDRWQRQPVCTVDELAGKWLRILEGGVLC